ncbi:MAG: RnfABCDGE type electron transport complex subunit D [Christensenellaceae bacterium]|nr:RnfABCDGE type electron transport complex subunit D [Christensenellaceae bacterium]
MNTKLVVTSTPFLRDNTSTQKLMLEVCIALLPTIIASVIIFGLKALIIVLLSVVSAIASEYFFLRLSHKKSTLGDLSAVVTGILVALNVPVTAPLWIPVFGSMLAIVLVKQMYGGIGQNFINPALAARTILFISWTALMSARLIPEVGNLYQGFRFNVDAVSVATPLISSQNSFTLSQLFLGNIPGMIGETSKIALLIGGIYLIVRKVIDWRIPVFFIGTVFILFLIKTGNIYSSENIVDSALGHVLSGGLMLGAFFMATDYVTCPMYKVGRIIMGIGCGIILFVIRAFGSYPEGCSFAILFMNVATPLIDKWTRPRAFGEV